ncbi:MAG: helix-turn-helix domain-containing protein [Bryobacteraceae bacterium]
MSPVFGFHVWGYEFFPNTRTVDAHVVKLRQELEPDANQIRHFLTVHGVGYRFLPQSPPCLRGKPLPTSGMMPRSV